MPSSHSFNRLVIKFKMHKKRNYLFVIFSMGANMIYFLETWSYVHTNKNIFQIGNFLFFLYFSEIWKKRRYI
jgi:hypothetical protein